MVQSSFVQGSCRVATRPSRSLDPRSFASPPRGGFAPAPRLLCEVGHRPLARMLYRRPGRVDTRRPGVRSSLPICEHVFAYGRLHPVLPICARGGPRGPAGADGRAGGAGARGGAATGGRRGGARGGGGWGGPGEGGGGGAPAPAGAAAPAAPPRG